MNTKILFYKDLNGANIPILTSDATDPENLLPADDEKEAIFKEWPQTKKNLWMLFQGIEFKLD